MNRLSLFNGYPETLRRSAEITMHTLVRTVFAKLHRLDPEEEEAKLMLDSDDDKEGEIRMTVTTREKEHTTKEIDDSPKVSAELPSEDSAVHDTQPLEESKEEVGSTKEDSEELEQGTLPQTPL